MAKTLTRDYHQLIEFFLKIIYKQKISHLSHFLLYLESPHNVFLQKNLLK